MEAGIAALLVSSAVTVGPHCCPARATLWWRGGSVEFLPYSLAWKLCSQTTVGLALCSGNRRPPPLHVSLAVRADALRRSRRRACCTRALPSPWWLSRATSRERTQLPQGCGCLDHRRETRQFLRRQERRSMQMRLPESRKPRCQALPRECLP